MTANDNPESGEKLVWATPQLEQLGTMDDVQSGGAQGGPDFEFDPSDPAS